MTVQINGREYPAVEIAGKTFAFEPRSLRAQRLFKERTGEGMLPFLGRFDGEKGLDMMNHPAELAAFIWASCNGVRGQELPLEDVEDLRLDELERLITPISKQLSVDAEQEQNPREAASETPSSTSESSGPSDAAA